MSAKQEAEKGSDDPEVQKLVIELEEKLNLIDKRIRDLQGQGATGSYAAKFLYWKQDDLPQPMEARRWPTRGSVLTQRTVSHNPVEFVRQSPKL